MLSSATAVGAVAAAAQGVILARWLGPRDFGVVSLIIAFPSVLFSFFDARSDVTTIKFVGEFREGGDHRRVLAVCRLGYVVDLSIALVTLAVTLLAASWAGDHVVRAPDTAGLLVLYAAAQVPNALATTSIAALTALGRFKLQAGTQMTVVLVRFLLVVGAVLVDKGIASVIVGYALSFVFEGSITTVVANRALVREFGESWFSARIRALRGDGRRIARFLTFTNLTELMSLAYKQLDLLLLGALRGPAEAGLYRLAKSSTSVLGLPLTPLVSVTYQRMVSVASHPLKLRELARRVRRRVATPLAAVVLVGGVALTALTLLLAGPAYGAALPAMVIWIGAYTVWAAFYWLRPFYYANGWAKQWFGLNLAASGAFFAAALPFFLGAGFVALTAARCTPVLFMHLAGFAFAIHLWRRRASAGWETKAGRRMWVTRAASGGVKSFTTANADHAHFVATVAASPALRAWFPRVWTTDPPGTVAVDWVVGRHRARMDTDAVAAVAHFQAALHTAPVPGAPSGFDYVQFIVDRHLALRDRLPHELQRPADGLVARLLDRGGALALSYPDLQPDNLIWMEGGFKVVDLELLSVTDAYGVDLLKAADAFDLDDQQLGAYLRAYVDAGGDLGGVIQSWDRCEALWTLRLVSNALLEGRPADAAEHLERATTGVPGERTVQHRIRETMDRVVQRL